MMKLLRILLFPIVPIYFFVTWLRNLLYDKGVKSSKSYDFPVICVGNLSTGGTGKTPMIEYLVRMLSKDAKIATLSRGYKRITNGFVLADESANVDTVGDEPLQFYNKFKDIRVAVDEDRQNGIDQLRTLQPQPQVILLDDAYQHRKVKASLNILLTAYNNLYYKDIVLPTGNLREPKQGSKRADVIIVTKCPADITAIRKDKIRKDIRLNKNQNLFFSTISYSERVKSYNTEIEITSLPEFTLVTGIADASPLVKFLNSKALNFEHLEFGDHYNFTIKDIEVLEKKKFILTTEKDYMRLCNEEILRDKLFYICIETVIDNANEFHNIIKNLLV